MKIPDNNVYLTKSRPRDLIINNDYDIKDRCRRRGQWIFFKQFDSKFVSYKEFKSQWDSNTKFIDQIMDKYYEKKLDTAMWKIKDKCHEKKIDIVVLNKTLIWFYNRRFGG